MKGTQPAILEFSVDMPSELSAGLRGFTDFVTITVESGDPGGEPGEFAQHVRDSLAEWFDGARVELVQKR